MIKNCHNCRYGDLDIDEKPCKECISKPGRTMWEPEKAKQKKRERPEMLGKPLPKYERESSRIPDQIRVSFSDGSTAIYDLRVDQPAPFVESIKIISKASTHFFPVVMFQLCTMPSMGPLPATAIAIKL